MLDEEAPRAGRMRATARSRRGHPIVLLVLPVLLLGLTHCGTGGPSDEEKKALAREIDVVRPRLFGPELEMFPELSPFTTPSAATGAVARAAAVVEGAVRTPFAEREADCSLTEAFVDDGQQTVVRRAPRLDLRLHARSGLGTTAGAFPQGCTDRVLGVASTTAAVAGRLPSGEYFGATTMLDEDGTLRTFKSRSRSSLKQLKTIPARPPGSAYELESLLAADLNGDGKAELIVALADFSVANGTGQVAVLKGRGKGKFAAPVFFPLPFPARGVTVANLTGDALPDIVALGVASSGSALASLVNLGGLSFAAAVPAPQGATGNRVIAADLDGDQKLDVATSGGQWLRGKGDGTFEAPVATGWIGTTLASGDFDHDDVPDVAVAGADFGTQVAIYRGLGGGAFERGEIYAGTLDPDGVAVSEIDGDGNLDVVIGLASGGLYAPTGGSAGVTGFLLGRGDGTFAGVPVRDGDVGVASDFDGDGRVDLLTADASGNTRFRLFRAAKKKLRFKPPVEFDEGFIVVDLASGKLDANDSPDFVALARGVSVSDPGTLHVRVRQGDAFVAGDDVTLGFAPTQGAARSIALGDFDGDGNLDVAVIGSLTTGIARPGVLVVYPGAGDGTLGPPSTIATDLLNPIALVAARLDPTGDTDLVLVERGDPFSFPARKGSTRVFSGNGDGTFVTPPAVLDDVDYPDALAVADVNGDERRDVLVAGADGTSSNTLQVWLRRASGRFAAPRVQQLVQFATTGIAVADVDRDGHADAVLSGCCGLAFTSVLLGKGNGKLGPESFLPMAVAGSRPDLVDLDGDGWPELLLSLEARAGIALLRNMPGAP